MKRLPRDVERQLFELSLSEVRLLDTTLDKAGLSELANQLRDILMDWRAYPSRTVYSDKDFVQFHQFLLKTAQALQESGESKSAKQALEAAAKIAAMRPNPGRKSR